MEVLHTIGWLLVNKQIKWGVYMNEVGNRIVFDQDGEILYQTGEMAGDVLPRKEIIELDFIDLEYGQIDYTKHRVIGVDINTKQPILEDIVIPKTEEQQRIEELENQILLMVDSIEGGIL